MAFRVSQEEATGALVIRVDGDLDDEAVVTVREHLASANGRASGTVLDVAQVRSADRSGVSLLIEVQQRGLALRGVSRYLELLIQTHQEYESS